MNPAKSFDYRKLFDLSGRVALVVGGGSGIGQAGAWGMAAQGAHVVVADIVPEDAKGVAERISGAIGKATSAVSSPSSRLEPRADDTIWPAKGAQTVPQTPSAPAPRPLESAGSCLG